MGLTLMLAELEVDGRGGNLAGRTVADLFRDSDVRLIAIVHDDGELTISPSGSAVLREGDRLMLYGSEDAIDALAPDGAPARLTD